MTNYFSPDYNDKGRWVSYWHQIKEILAFNPRRVLVIGKGDGVVPAYLKNLGLEILTLDIDSSLNPDITASVLNMPVDDNSFDIVLCAEVLEHLSYDEFSNALSEIKRVVKNMVIVSLPHFGPAIRFFLKLPFLSELKLILKLPYPVKHQFKGEHYWEIGKYDYPLRRIKNDIKKSGFTIKNDYIVFENPLHHFFVLKK
ncbi:methyltransferase domain-containing protein [Patescibacteria group bacterium]|nr:methyltransferase domain-containing protein [Patescibacteria group bacterium]